MKKLLLLTFAILLLSCELDPETEITEDEPEIEIQEIEEPDTIIYTTRFIINRDYGATEETLVNLDYPLLTRDGVEYNIETMTPDVNGLPVKSCYIDTERLIYVDMVVESEHDIVFRNDASAEMMLDFNLSELDITNMLLLLEYINYVPQEEMIPDFETLLFNLSGTVSIMDSFELTDYSYLINDIETTFINADGPQVGTVKTIPLNLNVGLKDDFILRNFYTLFNWELSGMTETELMNTIDILNRYPEEDLNDIIFCYYPDSPRL